MNINIKQTKSTKNANNPLEYTNPIKNHKTNKNNEIKDTRPKSKSTKNTNKNLSNMKNKIYRSSSQERDIDTLGTEENRVY